MSFITSWVTNKVSEYAKVGLQAGGSMAGNAVGGVGTMVENAGRSAGGGVTGSIANVGNYINGYGDSIKSSMASDGPVSSSTQKKTAVKPSGAVGKASGQAQKTVGGAQQKALPAAGGAANKAGGAAKSVGSNATRNASSTARTPSRPNAGTNAMRKEPSTSTRSAASYPKAAGAGGGSSALRSSNGPAQNTRASQATNKVQNRSTDGKVRVGAASRPGAKVTSTRPPVKGFEGKKHDAKDPLGVGVK